MENEKHLNKHLNGALKGKRDIRDWKLKKKVVMAVQYPETFSCIENNKIKNQGAVGSCVAHAMSEILEYHDDFNNTLSTNFIYGIHNYLYGSEGPGMYLREACKIAKDYGDPKESYCKGNTEVKNVYMIANDAFVDGEAMEDAAKHKIVSYAKLSNTNDIKYALMHYGPVLAAVTWYSENVANKSTDYVLKKGTTNDGGHALMIYGWNEKGFLVQNSWGTSWGNKGVFILPYDYKITESYSMMCEKENEAVVQTCKVANVAFSFKKFFVKLFGFIKSKIDK